MSFVSEARSQLTQCILTSQKTDLLLIVNKILKNSEKFSQRYYCIDCSKLLRENASETIPALLKALKILEKYGTNLLRKDRPSQWRVIRWSNPIFQSYVDIIKGSRSILQQMGYLESIVDGASFPASVIAPDREIVAIVTSDVALLKYELDLFQKNKHPNPSAIVQSYKNHQINFSASIKQPTLASRSNSKSSSSSIENLCNLCGQLSDFYCPICKMKQCANCDKMWHSKSDRSLHKRTLLHSASNDDKQPSLSRTNTSPLPCEHTIFPRGSVQDTVNQTHKPIFNSNSFKTEEKLRSPNVSCSSSAKPIPCSSNTLPSDSNLSWDEKLRLAKTLLKSNSNYAIQQKILFDFCKEIDEQVEEYYKKAQELDHLPSVKQHFLERSNALSQQKKNLKIFVSDLNKKIESFEQDNCNAISIEPVSKCPTKSTVCNLGKKYSSMQNSTGILINDDDDELFLQSKERQEYSDVFFGLTKKETSSNFSTLDINHQMWNNCSDDKQLNNFEMAKNAPLQLSPEHSANAVLPFYHTGTQISCYSNVDLKKQFEMENLKIASLKTIDKIRSAESKDLLPVEIQLAVEEAHRVPIDNHSVMFSMVENLQRIISDMLMNCPLVSFAEASKLFLFHDRDEELTKQAVLHQHNCRMKLISQPNLYSNTEMENCVKKYNGDINKALIELQKPFMRGFNSRLKNFQNHSNKKLTVKKILEIDNLERLKTILIAIFRIKDITIADMMCTILLGKFDEADICSDLLDVMKDYDVQDIYEASKSFPDNVELTLKYLSNKCDLCLELFPQNKVECMTACGGNGCTYCQGCLAHYLKIKIQEGHIRDLVCPVCKLPDIDNGDETAVNHFAYLDIVIKKYLDEQIHSVYQKKLTDQTLMKMPNFRWCSHCENGFVYELNQNSLKMLCPACKKATCYKCKKRWEDQHEGISCQAFLQWKQLNDENFQAEGLAAHLKENGIDCPACNFRYALAKGGCMHFKCLMCSYQFCSGCKNPFKQGQVCSVLNICPSLGLHAHHPRDCLFYLRDLEVDRLQKILSNADVQFGTEAKHHHNLCQVPEQKETSDGLEDGVCGREVLENNADLCTLHYKEYLVNLINDNRLDPASVFTIDELETCLRRSERCFTTRLSHQSDDDYKSKLLGFVKKLPLIHEMKINSRQETFLGNTASQTFDDDH